MLRSTCLNKGIEHVVAGAVVGTELQCVARAFGGYMASLTGMTACGPPMLKVAN